MNIVTSQFLARRNDLHEYQLVFDESLKDTWRMQSMCRGIEFYDKAVKAGFITKHADIESIFELAFELLKKAKQEEQQ